MNGLADLSGGGGGWHGGGHRGWGGGWRWSSYPVFVGDQTPTWCWVAVGVAALLLVMNVAGRR